MGYGCNTCTCTCIPYSYRSDIFIFLLSTRAGGLGINLTAADTVSEFPLWCGMQCMYVCMYVHVGGGMRRFHISIIFTNLYLFSR